MSLFSVPSLPPQDVFGFNTSSQSIMVTFSPVPQKHRRGIVRKYKLQYSSLGEQQFNGIKVFTRNVTSVEVTGLLKFTNYSITVAAFTVEYSNFSTPITVSTAEDGK